MAEEKTEAKSKTGKATKTNATQPIVMYVGPTIPNIVTCNSIFNNGIPNMLEQMIVKLPVIKALIVPVETLTTIRSEINKKNSATNLCYEKVLNYIKGGE